MRRRNNRDILDGGIYEIAFTERDKEIKKIELMRKHIDADLEDAVAEYVKAGGKKRLLRRKRRNIPPIAEDGADPRDLG